MPEAGTVVSSDRSRASSFGVAGAVLGAIALVGAAGITASVVFNPPQWLRFVTFWAFLLGLPASVILAALGLRAERRAPAILGLSLSAVAIVAMVVLQARVG